MFLKAEAQVDGNRESASSESESTTASNVVVESKPLACQTHANSPNRLAELAGSGSELGAMTQLPVSARRASQPIRGPSWPSMFVSRLLPFNIDDYLGAVEV